MPLQISSVLKMRVVGSVYLCLHRRNLTDKAAERSIAGHIVQFIVSSATFASEI